MMNYSNSNFFLSAKKGVSFILRKFAYYLKFLVNIDGIIAEISDKPASIGFETVNICSANCVFCAYQYMNRPKAVLPMDLFKKAIDEFDAFGGGGVGFTPVSGDPLVDPDFIEKIKYARSKKNISRIGFFTNGILINRVGARSIITSGVDEITVSVPGFDAETYFRIFRVKQWENAYDGLASLLRENELFHNRVRISIGLRSDIPLRRILREPAYKNLKKFKFDLQYNIYYDSWSGRIKQEALSWPMRLRKISKKTETCAHLFTGLMVLSNGNLTLCGCRDLDGDSELALGNIKDKSILEAWRDPRVKSVREGFYSRDYPRICRDCLAYVDLSCFRAQKVKSFLKKQKGLCF